MKTREHVIDKVVKVLRLSRGAGTEAEAQTALLLAQKLMYEHDLSAGDIEESGAPQPIEDSVVDSSGQHVVWKEYLAAIIAESFRCAYIISESRSSGQVRLVFIGRRSDVLVATEAYQASAAVAAALAEDCASRRDPGEREAARSSFLTGFLKGLLDRLTENAGSTALVVVPEAAVLEHAAAFANGGEAAGGALATSDPGALHEGLESGRLHASGTRLIRG